MIKVLFFIFLIISPTGLLQAQKNLSTNQQAVQQAIRKMFESLSNRDSISLKDNCSSDVLFFEYGQIWNLDTLIRKAITQNTSTDFKRINSFDFIDTTVEGNTAWASYYLKSEFIRDGKQSFIQWLETVVSVKSKKRWKVKVLHSSLVKRG